MSRCSSCGSPYGTDELDLGSLAVSHHYAKGSSSATEVPFALAQCATCGLVQNKHRIGGDSLLPQFPWITFNEPSAHLAILARKLVRLLDLPAHAKIVGLSSKDEPLITKFREIGYTNSWSIDPAADCGYFGNPAGVSWLQDRFDISFAKALTSKNGYADLLVVRHFLEHVENLSVAGAALRELVAPKGFAVIEVPDCEQPLRLRDACLVWEEHHSYFTKQTLFQTLLRLGFRVVALEVYESLGETCLVAIVQNGADEKISAPHRNEFANEVNVFRDFVSGFQTRSREIRNQIEEWSKASPVAIFGAGHHANTFIHAYNLESLLGCVLDDHPKKIGYNMPGTLLSIKSSSWLSSTPTLNCLSSLAYEIEEHVLAKQTDFLASGGRFWSIFPGDLHHPFRLIEL